VLLRAVVTTQVACIAVRSRLSVAVARLVRDLFFHSRKEVSRLTHELEEERRQRQQLQVSLDCVFYHVRLLWRMYVQYRKLGATAQVESFPARKGVIFNCYSLFGNLPSH